MKHVGITVAVVAALALGLATRAGFAQRNAADVPPGDWRTINRDLAANRYSPLKQINTSNVSSLKEAWTTRLGGGVDEDG